MKISLGIPQQDRVQAAQMYWHAFSSKLSLVMGPETKGLQFTTRVLRADHALCAHDRAGALLGVAGFKTHEGALVGGSFSDLRAVYGPVGAIWRAALLHALERDTENERFLMDGIFVAPGARGQGVGTALLNAICDLARTRGYKEVRLDVIDTNPRARALYERQGFLAKHTQNIGWLHHVFGFRAATTMIRPV